MRLPRHQTAALGCAALTALTGCASGSGAGRPAGERVPARARAVTISMDIGLNQGKRKPPEPVTVTAPARVRALTALVNSLPLFPLQHGPHSCPADFGDSLTLKFLAAPGRTPLAVAVDELSGCATLALTVGTDKKLPALWEADGRQILKIAGLPWKIPSD